MQFGLPFFFRVARAPVLILGGMFVALAAMHRWAAAFGVQSLGSMPDYVFYAGTGALLIVAGYTAQRIYRWQAGTAEACQHCSGPWASTAPASATGAGSFPTTGSATAAAAKRLRINRSGCSEFFFA